MLRVPKLEVLRPVKMEQVPVSLIFCITIEFVLIILIWISNRALKFPKHKQECQYFMKAALRSALAYLIVNYEFCDYKGYSLYSKVYSTYIVKLLFLIIKILKYYLTTSTYMINLNIIVVFEINAPFTFERLNSNYYFYWKGSSGGVKIRPIRLPQREKVTTAEEDEAAERNNEPVKRPATDIRRSNTGSPAIPSSSSSASKKSASSTSAPTPAPKRPRICIRLVHIS